MTTTQEIKTAVRVGAKRPPSITIHDLKPYDAIEVIPVLESASDAKHAPSSSPPPLCYCMKIFFDGSYMDLVDDVRCRAFVSALMKGHATCMARLAQPWSAEGPSGKVCPPLDKLMPMLARLPQDSELQRFAQTWFHVESASAAPYGLNCGLPDPAPIDEYDSDLCVPASDDDDSDVEAHAPRTPRACEVCKVDGVCRDGSLLCSVCLSLRRFTCYDCKRCQATVETINDACLEEPSVVTAGCLKCLDCTLKQAQVRKRVKLVSHLKDPDADTSGFSAASATTGAQITAIYAKFDA